MRDHDRRHRATAAHPEGTIRTGTSGRQGQAAPESGTPYLALEVSAAQKGSAFARDGYLHQSLSEPHKDGAGVMQ